DSTQQRKILHVASADLHHVGVLFNKIGGFGIENFCDDADPESLAQVAEYLQAFFAQALKRIRRRSRLERAAAKQIHARRGDQLRDRHRLFIRLNRARTRDDHRFESSDFGITDVYNCVVVLEVTADEFVGLGYSDRFGHTREHLEMSRVDGALVSGYADRCAGRAGHRMRLEPETSNDIEDFFNLSVSGFRLHYDEH